MIVVVCGPGGVGKGTVVQRLLQQDPRLWLSRSWTTRARRPGEAEDAYVFASREQFERRISEGGFIEWVEFLDYLQGSPVPDPPDGNDVLFEIDVHGAGQIRAQFPDAVVVFVDAPSRDEQAARMRVRGDDESSVARRLAKADEEVEVARLLGSTFVVNDDLDATVAEIAALIEREREGRVPRG